MQKFQEIFKFSRVSTYYYLVGRRPWREWMNYFKKFQFFRRSFNEEKMQEIHLFIIHSLKLLKYQHVDDREVNVA